MKALNRIFVLAATTLMAAPAFAQEAAGTVATHAASSVGLVGVGIGIMMGLAVLGGTLGQGKAAAAALEGVARNPAASDKLTVPLILSLALMESLVLFAFLIGFFLQGSVVTALSIVK